MSTCVRADMYKVQGIMHYVHSTYLVVSTSCIVHSSCYYVPLYFAKNRQITFWNNQKVLVDDDRIISNANKTKLEMVRFRTLGCYPLSGAIPSRAKSIEEIILELLESKISERAGRSIDQSHSSAMEERKREGYF